MIKVAHFISSSGLYGAERWVLALLRHSAGTDNLLVCPSTSEDDLLQEADRLSIAVQTLDVSGNFALLDFVRKLVQLIKSEQIDILHTHGYKSDIIGYFAARLAGIRLLSTPHGWSFNAGFKLRLYEQLDRAILKRFDMVVPLSEGLRESIGPLSNDRMRVIGNFVDLDSLVPPEPGDDRLVTYIGQLIERKRVQDLITALSILDDTRVRLQIIGDGPLREELVGTAESLGLSERVDFLGFRSDRLQLLNRSGIMVLPSLMEGIPRALMEGMAMERFAIGTDIPGTRELITDQQTGILVPEKSPDKIAEAIAYVLDHPERAREMAIRGRERIESRHSAAAAAGQYRVLYQELTDRGGPLQAAEMKTSNT